MGTTAKQQRVTLTMGQWLRKNRLARKHTIYDVAAAIGRNYRYVSDVELGRRGRHMDPVIGLIWCEYLALSPDVLFNYLGIAASNASERFRVQHYLQTGAWAHRFVQGVKCVREASQLVDEMLEMTASRGPLKSLLYQLRDKIRDARASLRTPQTRTTDHDSLAS